MLLTLLRSQGTVTGDLVATESGFDSTEITGTLLVQGNLSASEAGPVYVVPDYWAIGYAVDDEQFTGFDDFSAVGVLVPTAPLLPPAGKVIGKLTRPQFYQPMFTGRVRKKRQEDIVLLGV